MQNEQKSNGPTVYMFLFFSLPLLHLSILLLFSFSETIPWSFIYSPFCIHILHLTCRVFFGTLGGLSIAWANEHSPYIFSVLFLSLSLSPCLSPFCYISSPPHLSLSHSINIPPFFFISSPFIFLSFSPSLSLSLSLNVLCSSKFRIS